MATYNTYQEAKIENPDKDIYLDESIFRTWGHDQIKSGVKCSIADYCMNERDFIDFGNMYCNGDLIYSEISGLIIEVGADVSIEDMDWNDEFGHKRFILRAAALEKPFLETGENYEHTKTLNFIRDRLVEVHGEPKNLDYMHKLNNAIAFVERMEEAKISNNGFEPVAFKSSKGEKIKGSIEINHPEGATGYRVQGQYTEWFKGSEAEGWSIFCSDAPSADCIDITLPVIAIKKPKRTNVSYEKLSFECAWRAIKAFEDGEKLYTKLSSEGFVLIDNAPDVLRYLYDLHERVETEITEREEFIEELTSIQKAIGDCHLSDFYDALYDSGKFKLVN